MRTTELKRNLAYDPALLHCFICMYITVYKYIDTWWYQKIDSFIIFSTL